MTIYMEWSCEDVHHFSRYNRALVHIAHPSDHIEVSWFALVDRAESQLLIQLWMIFDRRMRNHVLVSPASR